ncbi:hypothetical protein ACFL13_01590 [Patescibacteria group bacterium]
MKKFTLILIISLAFVVTACIPKKEGGGPEGGGDESSITGSLKDLLGMGKSIKCTGEYSGEDGKMQMTVFVAKEKSYTEIDMEVPDQGDIKSYSIFDGEWFYMWGNMMNGTKMKIDDIQEMADENDQYESGQGNTKGFNKDYDYKCRPWIPDNSKFTPPSDIEFVDMTQMMEGLQDAFGGENGDTCAICDMVPEGADKDECLVNLGCK